LKRSGEWTKDFPNFTKILKAAVIGASGYIGSHIWQECLKLNAESTGTYFKKKKPGLITLISETLQTSLSYWKILDMS
jgi:UDP-glucose 4-epimerase